jgi:hypothetical protein
MPSDRSHAEPLEGVVVTVRVLAVQVLEQVDLGTAGLARGGRRIDVGVGHPQHPQRRRRMQRGRRRQHRQRGQGRLCPWPLVVHLAVEFGWRRRARGRSLRRPSIVLRPLPSIITATATAASASASAAAAPALHLHATLLLVLLVIKLRDALRFYVRHLKGQRWWARRPWRRLAQAPKAVAGRPVARPLALGAASRAQPQPLGAR